MGGKCDYIMSYLQDLLFNDIRNQLERFFFGTCHTIPDYNPDIHACIQFPTIGFYITVIIIAVVICGYKIYMTKKFPITKETKGNAQ